MSIPLALEAVSAAAEDFMPMPEGNKSMSMNRSILKTLHHGALEFDDPVALDADHMVVVRPVRFKFEFRTAVCRSDLGHQGAFLEKFDGPEDRCPSNRRVLFL